MWKQHFQLGVKSSHTIALKKEEALIANGLKEISNTLNALQIELDRNSVVKNSNCRKLLTELFSTKFLIKYFIQNVLKSFKTREGAKNGIEGGGLFF